MAKRRPSKKRSDFATAKEFQAYKKRSIAAKKARVKKAAALLHAQKVMLVNLEPSIRGLMARLENLTLDESKRVILALQAQNAAERLTAGFVDDLEISKLRKNMAIALEPSRLRHMGPVTEEIEKMLKRAAKKGKRALRKKAKEFAEYFDVPLREVYTLFFSP